MPAPMSSSGWADSLEPGIRAWFWHGFNRFDPAVNPSRRMDLFNVVDSIKDTEHYETYGVVPVDGWNNFKQTGIIPTVNFDTGFKTNIQNVTFAQKIAAKREWLEDNLYPQIYNPAEVLGDSAALKMEMDAASVFNNATSGSYLGADGVALASAAHPNGPSPNTGTQSNAGSLTLTPANIETTRIAMINFTDDKGGLLGVTPDTILVPPNLEYVARQAILSSGDPTTANRADNPRQGAYNIIPWNFLTTTNRWMMIDSRRMKRSLIWQNRVAINIQPEVMDTTVEARWIARMRYSYGWVDWRWIYVNN